MVNGVRSSILVVAALVFTAGLAYSQDVARGYVYVDENGNGRRDAGERGVEGVRVSNGKEIVVTDSNGQYEIELRDGDVLFISKPAGYDLPLDHRNHPQFYYVHRPTGTPAQLQFGGVPPTGPLPDSIDFELIPYEEPEQYRVTLFGDTQPYNEAQLWYTVHDVMMEAREAGSIFGVTLGDVVGDDLDILEQIVKLKRTMDAPWHYVYGNHDMDFDVPDRTLAAETWKRILGPRYYSYTIGKVHYVILDNIDYLGQGNGYRTGMDDDQWEWFERELSMVSHDHALVVMQHIPVFDLPGLERYIELTAPFAQKISFSAHWHSQRIQEIGDDHLHYVVGTISGSWWQGELDEFGIPHALMRDGTPRGYLLMDVDGTDLVLTYKVTRRPEDFQMTLHAPNRIARGEEATLYANVFLGHADDTVEVSLGGREFQPMEHSVERDPYYLALKSLEEEGVLPATGRRLPNPIDCVHLWRIEIPEDMEEGIYVAVVRWTDRHGRTFVARRVFEIYEPVEDTSQVAS